jgi:hypothetical protein
VWPDAVPAPKLKHFLFGLLCPAAVLHCRAGLVEVVVDAKRSVAAVGTYDALDNPRFTFHGTGFVVGDGNLCWSPTRMSWATQAKATASRAW